MRKKRSTIGHGRGIVEKKYVITLHRYYVWAEVMKTYFDHIELSKPLDVDFWKSKNGINKLMYMSIWYGLLYVVVEGWKELKLSNSEIDRLLDSPNIDLLRRYRNGTFHFQRKYFDDRFLEFWRDGVDSVTWIRNLHEKFGRFFLEYFDSPYR